MRKVVFLTIAMAMVMATPAALAQCTAFSSYGSANAPVSGGTVTLAFCAYAGEYATIFNVVAGETYINSSTITTDFITIRQGTYNGPAVAWGTTPVEWTASSSGTYYHHVHTGPACGSMSSCRDSLMTHVDGGPSAPGNNCSDPFLVTIPAALPFVDNNYTCARGNDYFNTCLGSYDGGEEIIYELIITATTSIEITLTTASTWTGIALDDSCPPDPASCIEVRTGSSGNKIIECLELTPGVYYIMIDTWPSPTCIPNFTLTIEECGTSEPEPGDDCTDPLIISCNSCVVGTTLGRPNSHGCFGSVGGGPDAVYEFTLVDTKLVTIIGEGAYDADWGIATTCDVTSDILCADRWLPYIKPSCSPFPGTPPDTWGTVNWSGELGPGTYYIWVDGYGSSAGDFALELICEDPCIVDCPPGGIPETEPCGNDVNGGCNMVVPAFEPIAPGQTICGTLWADAGFRDTDWFEVIVTEWTEFTFEGSAEVPFALGYVQWMNCADGSGDCNDITGMIAPFASAAACETASVTVNVGPGTHWFIILPTTFYDYPCDQNYNVTLTSAPGTAPVDYCSVEALNEDEYIANVLLGDIDNDSFWDGYGDYTHLSTDLVIGETYTITITLGSSYADDTGALWIDWNQDLDFCDTDEAIVLTGSPGVGPYTADITVPAHALPGPTRMRVGLNYLNPPVMCGTSAWGDYEDYTVVIIEGGLPDPADCAAVPAEICVGDDVELTAVYDLAYDLYWFTDACGDDITNAIGSGSPLTVSPTVTTTYFARVYDAVEDEWSDLCCDVQVTVNPNPVCTISGPPNIVEGESEVFTVPEQPGAVYLWTVSAEGAIVGSDDGFEVEIEAIGNTGDNITIEVEIDLDGCICIASIVVPIGDPPPPPPIPATGPFGIGLLLLALGGLMRFARRRK